MVARTLFVASSGEHLQELLQLRPTLVAHQPEIAQITEITWVTSDCAQSRSLLADEPNVIYVSEVRTPGYRALVRSILSALSILRQVRPRRVYCTGAGIALAFLPLAVLVGARATYLESATRVRGASATGRLLNMLPWIRLRAQHKSSNSADNTAPAPLNKGSRTGPRALIGAVGIVALVGTGAFTAPADAVGRGAAQSVVPNTVPSKATPNITNGIDYAIDQVGSLIITGGSFTTAQNPGSTTTLTRNRVLAFDASTGNISTTFAPNLDGTVQAIAPGPTANTVYVGGLFGTVNGVKSKGITLLNTQTGAIVAGFKPPALNGAVYTIALTNGHLLLGGSFTLAGASTRDGLASLNPTTGALDTYLNIAMTGHHNYNGKTGANGAVGPRSMAVNPAGTRLVVLGNFKNAGGTLHDQIAMIDLSSTSAVIDPNWSTLRYSAACSYAAFDTYVSDVQWSPDGSYFVTDATGGGGISYNTDGSRSLCDSASRWEASVTGTNVAPTWTDYTGNDTFWSVAVSGTAIYVGGHERWVNNDGGTDSAGAGAIPRPGMAALDPLSGLPLKWNPGRNPRGAGAYAMFVNASGLYVGSDTDYFGNYAYKHQKLGYFPLTGGTAPASTSTAALPANVYLAGPLAPESGYSTNDIYYRNVNGTTTGATTGIGNTGLSWSGARGVFAVGSSVFYAGTDGTFYKSSFNGTTFGSPVTVDPYNDPAWATVKTGSGTSVYRGLKPSYFSTISSVTGAFYSNGRLFYTLSGQSSLYWRWFSPDSGAVGATANTITNYNFSKVAGMFGSGSSLYWANSSDGTLHRITLDGTTIDATSDTVVGGPAVDGHDWRARGLFTYGSTANQAPTASATSSCSGLTCTFDGTGSKDADGTVAAYNWNFGDGAVGTGATPQHVYTAGGTFNVTLTVTDNQGATSTTWTGQVTPSATSTTVGFVGAAGVNGTTATSSVTTPSATATGNTELLFVTTNTAGVTGAAPTGFTQIAQETNAPLETFVYSRTATATDAGSAVKVTFSSAVNSDVRLLVYSGVGTATASVTGDTNSTSHTTPAVLTSAGSSWLVSYWGIRSSTTSTWTTPSSVTVRSTGAGTKSAHVDSVVGDTGPLAVGSYGALTAGSVSTGGKGGMASVVLAPSA